MVLENEPIRQPIDRMLMHTQLGLEIAAAASSAIPAVIA
jgi:hypothetical protein